MKTVSPVFSSNLDPFEMNGVLIVCVFLKIPRIEQNEKSKIISGWEQDVSFQTLKTTAPLTLAKKGFMWLATRVYLICT